MATSYSKGPDKTTLRRYLEKGLTQREIVEAWEKTSGHRVSRSAIGMAIERYGLQSAHPRNTYVELLPWVLPVEHRQHVDARFLRLEGRLRAGLPLKDEEATALANWKADLKEANAVVHYEPNSAEGFYWIERTAEHGDDLIDRSNAVKSAS